MGHKLTFELGKEFKQTENYGGNTMSLLTKATQYKFNLLTIMNILSSLDN